jgi:hypothetical protein
MDLNFQHIAQGLEKDHENNRTKDYLALATPAVPVAFRVYMPRQVAVAAHHMRWNTILHHHKQTSNDNKILLGV